MNILYHNKTFIVHYSPPTAPGIADENAIEAAIQGEKSVRALTSGATQKIARGRHDAVQEGLDPSLLVRGETLADGRTQYFILAADVVKGIYSLTDNLEYIVPYQAAIRAYVKFRLQQTETKPGEKAAVAVVDIQGAHCFISILDNDAVELFRVVKTEDLPRQFLLSAGFYTERNHDRELFLMVNSQEAASALLSAGGGVAGPDIIPEPCPALWALHSLEIGPRFILPELEAKRELARQKTRDAVMLGVSSVAAGITATLALTAFLTYKANTGTIEEQRARSLEIEHELKSEIEAKLTSWVKAVQPPWHEVIMEIALLVPEGAKIEKMDISEADQSLDTITPSRKYGVSIRVVLEDPNPGAAREAAAMMKKKFSASRHLKALEIKIGGSVEGKIALLVAGSLEAEHG